MKLRTDKVSKRFQPLFAEMVQAARPCADSETDGLL